jgi:colicin import membrane protein
MDIARDIKDRIVTAANSLYEEGQRADFPTVAAVRARAGVDMNAASVVMRDWRRSQTAQAAPLAVEVPDKVRATSSAALATLWSEAQTMANASLLAAQAAWDAERAEAETLRGELAAAFDAKETELTAAQQQITSLQAEAVQASKRMQDLQAELAGVNERAGTAEARAQEIERRVSDLRTELDRAHEQARLDTDRLSAEVRGLQDELRAERERGATEVARARSDLDQARTDLAATKARSDAEAAAHAEQRKQAAAEAHRLVERTNKAEADRDAARQAAGHAREEAARLQGKNEALESVQADLARLAQGQGGMK